MNRFLDQHGWTAGPLLAEDGSARRYYRVSKGGRTAIFMHVFGDTPNHDFNDFIRIGKWFQEIGLKTPEIYEIDEESRMAIMEDFGDVNFKQKPNYDLAGQVLEYLGQQEATIDLPNYFEGFVHMAHRRVIDWYTPAMLGRVNPDGLVEEYLAVWKKIEDSLPPPQTGVLHCDYHVENLMWLPQEQGLHRCGILDFQGAMLGPLAYDLGNLLEDMRSDVPQEIQDKLLEDKDEAFLAWYRVLTTQFHCRLSGQILRWLVVEDKPGYMKYLPRIQNYIDRALKDPLLQPVAQFFAEEGVDFSASKDLDALQVAEYIRSDAV